MVSVGFQIESYVNYMYLDTVPDNKVCFQANVKFILKNTQQSQAKFLWSVLGTWIWNVSTSLTGLCHVELSCQPHTEGLLPKSSQKTYKVSFGCPVIRLNLHIIVNKYRIFTLKHFEALPSFDVFTVFFFAFVTFQACCMVGCLSLMMHVCVIAGCKLVFIW